MQLCSPKPHMALPTTITQLVSAYSAGEAVRNVACVFCKKPLTTRDCLHFEKAYLRLVWKLGVPYAACVPCINRVGYLECNYFYSFSMFWNDVEAYTGVPLPTLLIRCYRCLCPLTEEDKADHARLLEPFHLIRYNWKGRCIECRNAWNALHSA